MAPQDTTDARPRHRRHHSVVPGEVPVPHGPPGDSDSDDYPLTGASLDERRVFSHVTRPDDSYTPDGVYWADLPWRERLSFVSNVDGRAAAQELATIGSMVKKDPLSPVAWYFRHAVIPGAGLGLEGYVLFSIGNLEPLFKQVWPQCWGTHAVCSQNWIASVTYLEIIGIMVGQAAVGVGRPLAPHLLPPSATDSSPSGHRRLDRPPLGPDSGCPHHACRPPHADRQLGPDPRGLGHLLCLVSFLLQCVAREPPPAAPVTDHTLPV